MRKPVTPLKVQGLWHEVRQDDTIAKVAEQYGASAEEIAELNDLSGDQALLSRKEIFVPKKNGAPPGTGAAPPAPFVPPGTAAPGEGRGPKKSTDGRCDKTKGPCLIRPVSGPVISGFGVRGASHHDGIDISAPQGTPVLAALDGHVLYSGREIKGYGNLIILRHEKGIVTVYAHNEENRVTEGDRVEQGQVIATVGNTGSASGFHLHFEVRVNEKPADPLLYLLPKEK